MNQEEQFSRREKKTEALVSLVSDNCHQMIKSPQRLNAFLQFFARIGSRWSAANAVAIYGQRPLIQNPVTIQEARQLGHQIKAGTQAISVLEPTRITEKLAGENAYLHFRKWAQSQNITEEQLRELCKAHVEHCLDNELDMRAPRAKLALRKLVEKTYPRHKPHDWLRLADYANQYLLKEGAFNPKEIKSGIRLYRWKANTSVVDLGIDTVGSVARQNVRAEVSPGASEADRRHAAALLRYMESRGWRIDYQQIERLSHGEKLDTLLHAAIAKAAQESGKKINVNAAAFCIYSQLGINRKFDLSTLDGWGKKPGEFMANLSGIRKIQKEITAGMERESIVIARLERELAQTEAHAELLRTRLANLGVTNPGSSPHRGSNEEKLEPGPIIKKTSPPATIADLGYQGLYFRIGRQAFLKHEEAATYLAASNFVDHEGKELAVQIKRRLANGQTVVLCVMTATQFASETLSVQSEPTHVKVSDAQGNPERPQIVSEHEIQSVSELEETQIEGVSHARRG